MIPFKDYFSAQAAAYAEFRPRYPDALFTWLSSIAPGHELAWDCATGSGQAAVGLVRHFARVEATDASATQLANAEPHARVTYRQASAVASGLEAESVDVVSVAQALHWLPLDAFFAEATRVLRTGGVMAVWCYDIVRIAPAIDVILDRFGEVTMRDYWAPERRLVMDHYRSVAFPFGELPVPGFVMEHEWTREHLVGYLRTWSAVRQFLSREERDPVLDVEREIAPLWPDANEPRLARWPLYMRVGRRAAVGSPATATGRPRR
ncbi:MAG TPA: class I SAM-dependent methyltransferase [Gemmatimonadaceae bacterium]|nr:class I SAM-dependent methyltransferase [Gemmatimonadaceae bacterium]